MLQQQPHRASVDGAALLAAYNAVFRVRGGARVASADCPTVQYAADRVLVLLQIASPDLSLGEVRGMLAADDALLLTLLFKAVAGDYVTGPAALRPAVCRIEADPASGAMDVTSAREGDEAVLVVLCTVLLAAVLVLVFQRHRAA